MGSRERREERRSLARRRAERHSSGFETTVLKVPEGCGGFFELKEGVHTIDIVPYTVGKGNPEAEPGELYYERTFWTYRSLGIEEKSYVCPSKTFGAKDYVAEYRSKAAKKADADPDYIKSLAPKERQVFLVWDHDEKSKGVQLWEISFHNFGELLDQRIKKSPESRGWDLFYYPDTDGMTLEITVSEASTGKFKYLKVTAIDFIPREKALPTKIAEHGICLDDLLVHTPYDKLKAIFLAQPEEAEEGDDDDDDDETPARRPAAKKKAPVEDDDDDDEPAPKKKAKPVVAEDDEDEWDDDEDDEPAPKKSKSKVKAEEDDLDDDDDEPAPKKKPAAAKKGKFAVDDEVLYDGGRCRVVKVSGDGTSLTLSDSDDELIRAVDPDDCTAYIAKAAAKKKAPVEDDDDDDEPASKKKAKPKAKAGDDDDDDDEPAPKKKRQKVAVAAGDDDEDEWDAGWED